MSLLRRALGAGALVSLLLSVPMLAIPRTLVEGSMGQAPGGDIVWVRLFGAAVFALGLVHVLILRKLDELWWWCWGLVLFDGVSAIVVILHAVVGLPEGSAAWPWWTYGVMSALFAALYLVGIARAGQEEPLV